MRTWLPAVLLAAAIGVAPPAALANGPSAGDNQYTDPLAGKTTTSTQTTTTTHTTPAPAPTTTPAPSTSSPAPAPATTAATPSTTSSSTSATSTTTVASTGAGDPSGTLPMTGFNAALGAALGALLLGVGVLVRRRVLS
jgi:LPXTG-motif cell wall-anchored protein